MSDVATVPKIEDLNDVWSNNLTVVDQLNEVPSGDYDPSVVLCTLEGILSDYGRQNRNGYWYSEELWDGVINSPDFQELVKTKTLFGESDHPMEVEDRVDVHYDYVSHCVRDVRIDRQAQHVIGKIDVLDTPAGRIIFTFVKYGSTLGVSSRGAGDVINIDGKPQVDPKTYQFYAWDIVHRPSNIKARVHRTESVDSNSRMLRLVESAKSDKKSLTWIKSLVESTEIQDKESVRKKINEYMGEFPVDDCCPPSISAGERAAYEATICKLKSDIQALSETLLNSNTERIQSDMCNNNGSNDTFIDPYNKLEKEINVLTEAVKMNTDTQSLDDGSKDEILDRVDEVYASLVKPISQLGSLNTGLKNQLSKISTQLDNLNSVQSQLSADLVASVQKSLSSAKDLNDLEQKLSDSDKDNDDLKIQINDLNDQISEMKQQRITDSRKYLKLRCSMLGLNESVIRRRFRNLSECTFDDIDSELESAYSSSSSVIDTDNYQDSLKESSSPVAVTRVKRLNESADHQSSGDSVDLLSLIKNNI
jgi:hypothetical protein